jgi:hypothetical protein
MPSIAVNTDDSPPENAQGGSTTKTVVAGVGTAVGTAISDVFAFIGIPGAGWGIGIASAIAVAATTAAATVVADPEASDVQYVGEANTPPATLTELTLREIVDVQAQMLPPPPLRTEFTVLNHFTFVRETDASTYTYSDADTVVLPCKVSFSTEGVPGAPLRFGVRPLDEGGQPIPSGGVIAQAWFAEPSLQTCTAQLLLQDDGRAPDDVAGDGLYTGLVPPGVTAANARLFVCVTRVGFDSTGVPAAVRYQEVPLASLLEADRSLHASGLQMGPARPNPAGAAGSDLAFSLPVDARVSLRVVDAAGRERLRPLDAAWLSAGPHAVRLRSGDLEPGVYFVTLRAWTDGAADQGASLTRRWTVVR